METKHSYEIPGIGGQRGYVSLEQNMLKVEKRRLKRVLAFWSVRWRKFKICFRIPENVVVKELPRFNATGKEAPNAGKNWRLCFESFSFTFRSRRILL
jgi:hypothetical protein